MYQWIRPELLLPVHGEMRHLMEHARYGLAQGIPQALVQTDGDIVRLAPGTPEKVGHAAIGRLVLDGDVILPADGSTINERRKLGLNGQISVALALNNGRLFGDPQVRLQGVPIEEDREPFLDDAIEAVVQTVRDNKRGPDALREAVRLSVRHVATRWTGKKPIVDVLIIEG